MSAFRAVTVAALVVTVVLAQSAADDLIKSLPGWTGTQTMYSGYVNVNASHGKELFYWLVEAANSPETAPLVLWSNGGPGCSGISGGLMSEFGPFFPASDGSLSLTPNAWTWTANANVIFIEQPVGVGFSYSLDTSDYTIGDFQSSMDVYLFLQAFMARFPQYATRDLYVSGESYGGHYVPWFSKQIIEGNAAGVLPHLNLKGMLVGNAWSVASLDNTGALDHWYTRAMIDQATHDGVLATCNMSDVGPLTARQMRAEADWEVAAGVPIGSKVRPLGFTPLNDGTGRAVRDANGLSCDDYTNTAFSLLNGINIYDTFANVCTSSSPSVSSVAVTAPGDSNYAAGCATGYDPCRDDRTTAYLNDPSVKKAIHANASITWSGCSSVVDYSRFDLLTSMLPVYQELIAAGLRILVFSGDVDAIVPTMGTRAWLAALGVTEKAPIRAYTVDGQVGGWTTQYNELLFATVPETQGSRGLYLFNSFINNTPL